MEYISHVADTPWKLERTETYKKHFRHYEKNHPNELAAVLNNLTRYMDALNAANHPRVIQAGYLHNEPAGVVAIDQRGDEGHLQATRLYTYAYLKNNTLYLLAIGNKQEQQEDIAFCKAYVKSIK